MKLLPCLAICASCLSTAYAQQAPTPAPTMGPQFQYAAITGVANSIVLTRVPVMASSGQTVYQDITLQFDNDGSGNLTLTNGYPVFTLSPNLQVAAFQPGKYLSPGNVLGGKGSITVSGPGVVSGGSTAWSISANSDADPCTYPSSATWYVGPIDNNVMASRLKKAGITSTAWSFGISGGIPSTCGVSQSFKWGNGSIVGVTQTGNTITFASFTNNSFDQASPVDQITYTLAPQQ